MCRDTPTPVNPPLSMGKTHFSPCWPACESSALHGENTFFPVLALAPQAFTRCPPFLLITFLCQRLEFILSLSKGERPLNQNVYQFHYLNLLALISKNLIKGSIYDLSVKMSILSSPIDLNIFFLLSILLLYT